MINSATVEIMRLRLGLEADDSSKDDELEDYTPREQFIEMCAWELGSSLWAETIFGWLDDCGLQITEKGTE